MFWEIRDAVGEVAARRLSKAGAAFAVALVAFTAPTFVGSAAAGDAILAFGARIAGDDARTRIVIDLDRTPQFSVHYLANPTRVVVDLPATAFGFPAKDLEARGLFSDIRYGTMDEDSARIVLTATKPVKLVLAEVQPDEGGKGQRLVLDAEMAPASEYAELVKQQRWTAEDTDNNVGPVVPLEKNSNFLIAVDAGHGGIDTGAVASDGSTPEKDITLAFAKALGRSPQSRTRHQGVSHPRQG